MIISYPSSWTTEEGDRPNTVQKFISNGEKGTEMAIFATKPIQTQLAPPRKQPKLYINPQRPSEHPPIINIERTQIEGTPAGITEYSIRLERTGFTINPHFVSYAFIHKENVINLIGITSHQTSGINTHSFEPHHRTHT